MNGETEQLWKKVLLILQPYQKAVHYEGI